MSEKQVEFTKQEKIENFDRIASAFYQRNFGQISKSDIELLMFDIYMEKMIKDCKKEDGIIDYSQCSDYFISKQLGITQAKVKNLKIKKELVYPTDGFEWKKSLASLTPNARYDSVSRKITVNIPDPNLYYEIQNYIEEQGGYVEYQLNSKVLQMRVEYYMELLLSLEPEQTQKEVIKQIRELAKAEEKNEKLFDEKHLGKSMLQCGIDVVSLLSGIAGAAPLGGAVLGMLKKLV